MATRNESPTVLATWGRGRGSSLFLGLSGLRFSGRIPFLNSRLRRPELRIWQEKKREKVAESQEGRMRK